MQDWTGEDERFDDPLPGSVPGQPNIFAFGTVEKPRYVTIEEVEKAANDYQSTKQGYRSLGYMTNKYRWIKDHNGIQKIRDFIREGNLDVSILPLYTVRYSTYGSQDWFTTSEDRSL